jgi:hypothetical protein
VKQTQSEPQRVLITMDEIVAGLEREATRTGAGTTEEARAMARAELDNLRRRTKR